MHFNDLEEKYGLEGSEKICTGINFFRNPSTPSLNLSGNQCLNFRQFTKFYKYLLVGRTVRPNS